MTNANLFQLPHLMAATQALTDNLFAAEPIVTYHQANARFKTDLQARDLVQHLSQAQADLRRKQASGGVTQTEVDQLRQLQSAAHANRVVIDYAQTQQAAVNYLRTINQEISQLIGVDFASLAQKSSC